MYIAIDEQFHILAAGNTDEECVAELMKVYLSDYDDWHKKTESPTYMPSKSLPRDRYYKNFDFSWQHIHGLTGNRGWSVETRKVKIAYFDGNYSKI